MTNDHKLSFTFVLHTHLPYVLYHGTWPHGTDWIYQASAECYIPLLNAFNRLLEEGIAPKVTIGISPVLSEQLSHPAFVEGLIAYLAERIQAAELDIKEFTDTGRPEMLKLAHYWLEHYRKLLRDFSEKYSKNIPGAFRELEEAGALEIITCAATHGYFPLLGLDRSIKAQIRQAVATHKKHYGKAPRGIWLPECAYRPQYEWKTPVASEISPAMRQGAETLLAGENIRYFFVDTALLKGGEGVDIYLERFPALKALWERMESARAKLPEVERPRTHHRPYWVGGDYKDELPTAVFIRDPDTALVVWSGEHGYPGDGSYMEFHKKRFPNGHRYWRVTSPKADLADKKLYDPEVVKGRIEENAQHFAELVESKLAETAENINFPPILVAPFDTELFGHWWFEGPLWIESVLRKLHRRGKVALMSAGEYLEKYPPDDAIAMPEGSWGQGGFHWIWLNDDTKWTWSHLYQDEMTMIKLLKSYEKHKDHNTERIMKQLGRELLLEQASDWQFLISTWAARDYAEARFIEHHARFLRIAEMAEKALKGEAISPEEWNYLIAVEKSDPVFPEISPAIWGLTQKG
jgi:1,4-alpha-glucan branching enzyme